MKSANWTPLANFEGYYEINEAGKVRSLHKRNLHGIIEPHIDRGGYYALQLSKRGTTSSYWLHRLIGETFIANPDKKRYINHRDGNKLNNAIWNLEWCTHAENIQHAYDNGLIKPKTKRVINKCTGDEFSSAKEAAVFYGVKYGTLRNQLNGNIKTKSLCLEYQSAA